MNFFMKLLCRFLNESPELIELEQQKGICDEYICAYRRIYPNPDTKHKLRLADALITLQRFSEAREILDTFHIHPLTDDETRGIYFHTLLGYYIGTKQHGDGLLVFQQEQKFLDIYWGSPARERQAGAYYDNAARILAMSGYAEYAMQYLQFEQQWAQKYDKTGFLPQITQISILNSLGETEKAEQEANQLRQKMEAYPYKTVPQKEAFMRMLAGALN